MLDTPAELFKAQQLVAASEYSRVCAGTHRQTIEANSWLTDFAREKFEDTRV